MPRPRIQKAVSLATVAATCYVTVQNALRAILRDPPGEVPASRLDIPRLRSTVPLAFGGHNFQGITNQKEAHYSGV
jgi:hypothetical protein